MIGLGVAFFWHRIGACEFHKPLYAEEIAQTHSRLVKVGQNRMSLFDYKDAKK